MHKSSHTSDKIWAEFISQQEKKIGHKPLGRNLLQFQSFFFLRYGRSRSEARSLHEKKQFEITST